MRIYFVAFFTFLFLSSCSSKKNVVIMQDIENIHNKPIDFSNYQISPGDILKISIISDLGNSIDLKINTSNSFNNSRESLIFDGYNVDEYGNFDFPQIGQISTTNLTIYSLEKLIQKKLVDQNIFTSISVDVKVLNWSFSILGEVNKPGKYFFDDENLNLFEALGIAGDLTINGKRNSVKLIRKANNKFKTFKLDLTDVEFIKSEAFLIKPDDIIIVDPNSNRIKNAGIIGNSGTLLSLLSFLLSSIILITN